MDKQLSLSIVLPCFNPQQGWAGNVLANYREITFRLDKAAELVLVNDGSTSGITVADIDMLMRNIPAFRYISYTENRGKGYALKQGIAAATGDIIAYTDIDFPYTTESFADVYTAASQGVVLAAGVKDTGYYSKVPYVRRQLSRLLRSMTKLFIDLPFTDTQCGLKAFRSELKAVAAAVRTDGYLFDLELVKEVHRRKHVITAVPVSLKGNVQFRRMNYRILLPELGNFIRILTR